MRRRIDLFCHPGGCAHPEVLAGEFPKVQETHKHSDHSEHKYVSNSIYSTVYIPLSYCLVFLSFCLWSLTRVFSYAVVPVLRKRYLYQFLSDHQPDVGDELRREYIELLSRVYENQFEEYAKEISKIQYDVASKKDLIASDEKGTTPCCPLDFLSSFPVLGLCSEFTHWFRLDDLFFSLFSLSLAQTCLVVCSPAVCLGTAAPHCATRAVSLPWASDTQSLRSSSNRRCVRPHPL